MATPNNVTPTNCSWWPISALENDAGKSKEGEENQDPTDPALRSQDRLVLYHWTQSFSSQKVTARPASRRNHLSGQGIPLAREDGSARSRFPGWARGAARTRLALLYPYSCVLSASPQGGGAQPNPAFAFSPGFAAGDASALCSLTAERKQSADKG